MTRRRITTRYLRVLFMVLTPAVIAYGAVGTLYPQLLRTTTTLAAASTPTNPLLAPPTGLQITSLDSTLHATWTPGSDSAIAWQLVSVWDGILLQQSKVVGRTARAAQANGLMPGHPYTVKVYSIDAQGGLSVPAQVDASTDEQRPMRNAAFFENFNEAPGDLSSDYFDVRTSQSKGQRPEDVGQAGKFLVFASEHHFHTEMIGGVERGELYIRPRVPMDLSDGGVRTFQTEFDVSATHHSEGKWPEIHFVDAAHVPWSAEEFGAGDGDDWLNSITFSVRGDNSGSTSNRPLIETNIAGVQNSYRGTQAFFTPVNIRVPVVIRMSRTMAELYINGDLAVRAGFNAPLPYTSGYWMLAHRSWYSDRDRVTSPVINQVVHWDTIQFDGPEGSYNPVVKTYIQAHCPGVIRNEHGTIEGCQRLFPSGGLHLPILIAEDANTARSAVLRFNGYSDNGTLDLRVNGQPMTLTVATEGYQNVLNSYNIPTSWLRNGVNTLIFSSPSTNDSAISEVQLEVVYNQQRVMNQQIIMGPMPMLQATSNNFRIDHLVTDPDVYTATTYLYNIGGTPLVPYTVEVLNPKPYLTLSQTSGALTSPSYGGGVSPLNMRFDFAGVSTDDEGDVIVVRVNGGVMPVYIGILVVASGATSAPTYVTTFPVTTTFNKNAIPDYHGPGDGTPVPTSTAQPSATQTAIPTATIASTTTATATVTPDTTNTAIATVSSTSTPLPTSSTSTPLPTNTAIVTATTTDTPIATPVSTNTPAPTSTPDGFLPPIPTGVPSYFSYGLFNANTLNLPAGVPLDFRYQYLAGGVNTGNGWADWNPNGGYATNYINAARLAGMTPTFIYYQILQSAPDYDEYSNFQITTTMRSYFDDFKLLMQRSGQAGGSISVDIEPDLTGVMQQHPSNTNDDASLQHVMVGSSGQADVAGYPDSFRGFYQALAHLRDVYAPNVTLGIDISPWGASADLVIALRNNPNYNWRGHADRTATYLNTLGPGFQLLYFNPADRDAAYYQIVRGSDRWWDANNVRQPTFDTMAAWLGRIVSQTQKRVMLWQVPNGNQLYRSENNTDGHWQDNRAEYFLNPVSGRSHMQQWANYGVLGIMFGVGAGSQSHYFDYKNDGITNPPAINGNDQLALFPDDDGGYLRLQLGAYALGGRVPLPVR